MTEKLSIEKYCNSLYGDLENFKGKLTNYIGQIESFKGQEREQIGTHAEHLRKIIETIDWKLEIIAKACPLDTKSFARGAVEGAGVPLEDGSERGKRTGGGSVGG